MSKIIGYVPGVFDLFHIGHLNILKRAKENCDFLMVGVTSDERSSKRKGKTPVIPLNERMEILSAIVYCDKVVPLEYGDKYYDWENKRFSRIFVGDDWRGSEKWNAMEQYFADKNVDVFYFPYTQTTSSTLIRSALENVKPSAS